LCKAVLGYDLLLQSKKELEENFITP